MRITHKYNQFRTRHQTTKGLDDLTPTPKLFVHIPKTAGTSFRTAAEAKFGESRILRDYGPDSDKTSGIIRSTVIESGEPGSVVSAAAEQNAVLVAGHVIVGKYGGILGLPNTATIFRDPVEQVISHYRHAVRHNGFEQDIMAFARQEKLRNLQSHYVSHIDPALIGVVGLTSSYAEMLEILNERWRWSLKPRRRNVHDRLGIRQHKVTDLEKQEIAQLNQEDRRTFARAQRVFNNSRNFFNKKIGSDCRGAITTTKPGFGIKGWAFDMLSDKLVEIEILLNGNVIHRTACSFFLPHLAGWKLPHDTHIGFEFEIQRLTEGDRVEIRESGYSTVLDCTTVTKT